MLFVPQNVYQNTFSGLAPPGSTDGKLMKVKV